LRSARLDTGKVEQRIDQLKQSQRIAVRHFYLSTTIGERLVLGRVKYFFQRAQHQRQRCTELVADVGEEHRLGAIDLSEGLGSPALLFVGLRVSQARGNLAGGKCEKAPVGVVELPRGLKPATRTPWQPVSPRAGMGMSAACWGLLSHAPVGKLS
jgi:hypothetical protein